jgi:hypothetical protein
MATSLLVKATEKMEITAFKRPGDISRLKQTHIGFTGSPRKHPYDAHKVILLADPYSHNAFYYEFKTEDIAFVEELASVVNINEEVVTVVRLWVRKGCVGLRCTPFWVENFG